MTNIKYFNFFTFFSGDDWTAEMGSSHVERIG
jgi:hypothetical protein